jgi:hypothetical protein
MRTADQLKRLAEVLPKEIGAKFYFYKEEGHLELTDPYGLIGADDDDYENARATFALLDAMEKAGYFPRLYLVGIRHYRCEDAYDRFCEHGLTRWEAVAQAALSVFERYEAKEEG